MTKLTKGEILLLKDFMKDFHIPINVFTFNELIGYDGEWITEEELEETKWKKVLRIKEKKRLQKIRKQLPEYYENRFQNRNGRKFI